MAKGDKGKQQAAISDSQQRYRNQQGAMNDAFAYNYGRGSEADYGNYTDIMNQYRDIASGGGSGSGGGGGGGGVFDASGMYTPFTVSPGRASYSDPFQSYGDYQTMSKTGGYTAQDMQDLRARGASPIRAAYENANREVGRQRSLQGGYSPNATATLAKMAREQGQSAADAMQNVNAGIINQRIANQFQGLGGMSNIEGQRLNADVDLSKFNTNLDFQGQTYNADAQTQAQARNIAAAQAASAARSASSAADMDNRMAALRGMTTLYGTTPGMSNLFGTQLFNSVGQGGQYDSGFNNQQYNASQMPSTSDIVMGRVNQGAQIAAPIMDWWENRNKGKNAAGGATTQGGGGIGPTNPNTIYRQPQSNTRFGNVRF